MKIKYLMLPTALAVALGGCGDLLTETPRDFITADLYYSTEADIEGAAAAMYPIYQDWNMFKVQHWWTFELAADHGNYHPDEPNAETQAPQYLNWSPTSREPVSAVVVALFGDPAQQHRHRVRAERHLPRTGAPARPDRGGEVQPRVQLLLARPRLRRRAAGAVDQRPGRSAAQHGGGGLRADHRRPRGGDPGPPADPEPGDGARTRHPLRGDGAARGRLPLAREHEPGQHRRR
jgi:hypothetical protein